MRVVGLTDIHGDAASVRKMAGRIAEADLTLVVGDLTHFGREKQASRILSPIEENCSEIMAVPGNCDFQEVEEFLDGKGFNLHGRSRLLNGTLFLGLGYSLFTPRGRTPSEFSDSYLERHLLKASSDLPNKAPLVLVSHQPPFGTKADSVADGVHVGSKSVRQFIEKRRPLICFTGHIHEGVGIDVLGETKVVNPGPLSKGKYAYAELGAEGVRKLEIREV